MNIERYSDLTKAILQVAQTEALGAGHARLEVLHILQATPCRRLACLLSPMPVAMELLASSVRDEVEKLARFRRYRPTCPLPRQSALLVSVEQRRIKQATNRYAESLLAMCDAPINGNVAAACYLRWLGGGKRPPQRPRGR